MSSKLPVFLIGLALFVHAMWYVFQMKDELQAAHHARTATASALSVFTDVQVLPVVSSGATTGTGRGLPLPIVASTFVSLFLMVYGGSGAFFIFHHILRKTVAAESSSFDQCVCTGDGFVSFNQRGRAGALRRSRPQVTD